MPRRTILCSVLSFVEYSFSLDNCLCSRDVHGNWNPSGNGNPMGMGQELNKQWEWEWDSIRMGMGMTPIPMGMDSHQRLRKIVEFRFRPKK